MNASGSSSRTSSRSRFFVHRIVRRPERADGDGLDAPVFQLAQLGSRLLLVERRNHRAIHVDALVDLDHQAAVHQRREAVAQVRIGVFGLVHARGLAAQPADLERVAESARGQDRGLGGVAREQRIQPDRRAVAEALDLLAEPGQREAVGLARHVHRVEATPPRTSRVVGDLKTRASPSLAQTHRSVKVPPTSDPTKNPTRRVSRSPVGSPCGDRIGPRLASVLAGSSAASTTMRMQRASHHATRPRPSM